MRSPTRRAHAHPCTTPADLLTWRKVNIPAEPRRWPRMAITALLAFLWCVYMYIQCIHITDSRELIGIKTLVNFLTFLYMLNHLISLNSYRKLNFNWLSWILFWLTYLVILYNIYSFGSCNIHLLTINWLSRYTP